jgi:hypothetical protein
MGRLENILDVLSTSGPEPAGVPLLSFGEFERLYGQVLEAGDEWQRKALAVASNPLVSFSPETRPVYWRMLIAQACLYQALVRTRQSEEEFHSPANEEEWLKLLRLEEADDFRWKSATAAPSLEETVKATQSYLRRFVVAPRLRSRQSPG